MITHGINYVPPTSRSYMGNIRPQLVSLLHQKTIDGALKSNSYTCTHADFYCILFDSNSKSKKVMVPMDVAIEWVEAYLTGQIYPEWKSRLKRDTITKYSTWSTTLHSFESHLNAILRAYIEEYE